MVLKVRELRKFSKDTEFSRFFNIIVKTFLAGVKPTT
tara:strand:- start:326 stop:436 length:111 start_codon:yes stop_codon:yes gene_type:complete